LGDDALRPAAPTANVQKAEAGSVPVRGLRECCKLPHWGLGQSPGQNRYPLSSPVVSFENLVTRSLFVCQIFFLKFRGVQTTKTPPSYGLGPMHEG